MARSEPAAARKEDWAGLRLFRVLIEVASATQDIETLKPEPTGGGGPMEAGRDPGDLRPARLDRRPQAPKRRAA
ncbi:MAG: hypothetical protein M3Q10_01470 [Chloroflexota bacterium]|nr:hypothetical protein [Chloroflexota bacterium]